MGKKILIIEDEKDISNLLTARLHNAGYEIAAAIDATQGIQMIHREKPDLIILDLMLPAGGGLLVLESLSKSSKVRYVPVVVLTGIQDEEYKKRVLTYNIDAYFEKPYNAEQLLKKINEILSTIEGGERWHA